MNIASILNQVILLPVYWVFTGMFFVENGDKKLVALVLISLAAILFKERRNIFKGILSRPLNKLLFITTISLVILDFIHGGTSQEIRTFICMFIFISLFPKELIDNKIIDMLLVIASVCISLFVFYNTYFLNIDRGVPLVGGGFNPIPYASAVSVIGVLSLYRLFNSKKLILFLPIILTSIAILCTETRGVIIPFFLVALFFLSLRVCHLKITKYTILTTIIISIGLPTFAYKSLDTRIDKTMQEINMINNGNMTSSLGLRIQFWHAAIEMIKEKPLLGHGESHRDRLQQMYNEGSTSKEVAKYSPTHYHNQYLDKWVKDGIIGLALLLILQIFPVLFTFYSKSERSEKVFAIILFLLFVGISIGATPFRQALSLVPILFSIYYLCIESQRVRHDEL